MIYIMQVIQPDGLRSPAFPTRDIKQFVLDIQKNAIDRGEWEDVSGCGLLLLSAIRESGSVSLSTMPVFSMGRYYDHFKSGGDLPDFRLTDFQEAMNAMMEEVSK